MRENELRIGNLVKAYTGYSSEVTKVDLNVLRQSGICMPIPLTEEWLIKFGFKKVLDGYWQKIGKQSLLLNKEFIPFYSDGNYHEEPIGIKLEYVHQLQNLFYALIGEELEFI